MNSKRNIYITKIIKHVYLLVTICNLLCVIIVFSALLLNFNWFISQIIRDDPTSTGHLLIYSIFILPVVQVVIYVLFRLFNGRNGEAVVHESSSKAHNILTIVVFLIWILLIAGGAFIIW